MKNLFFILFLILFSGCQTMTTGSGNGGWSNAMQGLGAGMQGSAGFIGSMYMIGPH